MHDKKMLRLKSMLEIRVSDFCACEWKQPLTSFLQSINEMDQHSEASRLTSHNPRSVKTSQYPPPAPRHARRPNYDNQPRQYGYGAQASYDPPPYAMNSHPAAGYGSAHPAVGYNSYVAPTYPQAARPDYRRPYHVPTWTLAKWLTWTTVGFPQTPPATVWQEKVVTYTYVCSY